LFSSDSETPLFDASEGTFERSSEFTPPIFDGSENQEETGNILSPRLPK
jgi:hypothetical protein